MAESTVSFIGPGVKTTEIDQSAPVTTGPQGVPAGVIGTSLKGPAYVPLTVATFTDFQNIFGGITSEQFGPMAVQEWLQNANAASYVKVLGVGRGEKRLSADSVDASGDTIEAGGVKEAGFTVGAQLPKDNGFLGDNPYANKGDGTLKGRTHFLATFMSDSAGSDFLTAAGLDKNMPQPVLRAVIMTPSGVIATLSSSGGTNSPTKFANADDNLGGGTVGLVDVTNTSKYDFVMFLNGHKNNEDDGYLNIITASFSSTSKTYMRNVLNTDPTKNPRSWSLSSCKLFDS